MVKTIENVNGFVEELARLEPDHTITLSKNDEWFIIQYEPKILKNYLRIHSLAKEETA